MLFHFFFKTLLCRNHWRVFKTDGMMWAIVMQFSLENSVSQGKFTTNGAIVMSHKREDVFLQHLVDLKSMHNSANSAKQASLLFSVKYFGAFGVFWKCSYGNCSDHSRILSTTKILNINKYGVIWNDDCQKDIWSLSPWIFHRKKPQFFVHTVYWNILFHMYRFEGHKANECCIDNKIEILYSNLSGSQIISGSFYLVHSLC